MKKKQWIIALTSIVLLVLALKVLFNRLQVSMQPEKDSTSFSVIGRADGPTSVFLAGKLGGSDSVAEYKQITMEEAKGIFAESGDYIILDVRRADEFAGGHIPGAINVANEDIASEPPAELPDMEQVIYVYCRSGRRSKEAASKLVSLGYTNIIECGGIVDWTGDLEDLHGFTQSTN